MVGKRGYMVGKREKKGDGGEKTRATRAGRENVGRKHENVGRKQH